jgi:bifunctional UDP-N-acetylglucosamine pyrophosphorylase/glucosamine-1-phosphate N-acetyltransferase
MKPEYKHKFASIILAAGKGTRMRSHLPKVLHRLAEKPLLAHVLAAQAALSPEKTVIVLAPGMESVQDAARKEYAGAHFAIQEKQLGTGDAVRCGLDAMKGYDGTVLVLYGDTPLITTETLHGLLEQKAQHQAAIALLGMRPDDPTGYGRLIMPNTPYVERIVECKDASPEEKKSMNVWGGIMAFDAAFLREAIVKLTPSSKTGEYYLTSLVEMAAAQKLKTLMVEVCMQEVMGINDRAQLADAEAVLQNRLRARAMENGATLMDPASVYFSTDTVLGQDVMVFPNVIFGPGVSVADGVEIRSFSHIEGAKVEKNAIIGPFARLRPGAVIGENAHVGNFVEIKKSTLGKGAKANHLSYVGDSKVGAGANIGAGTITCNYDGISKYETVIGENAFIGSNSSLVAPVTIGAGAIVGAGSVITQDVEADALAIARGTQVNKPAKARQIKQQKQKNV